MESVGELLRRTREAQGKTIEEVAKATRMSRVVLEYLADDSFRTLPAPVYVKGHIRTYPRHLELDEWDAVEVEIHDRRRLAGRRWTWIVVVLVALAVVVVYAWRQGREIPPPEPDEMMETTHAEEQQRPDPVNVEGGAGSVADDTMIVWHKLELMAVARERTWISVSTDGEASDEVTLEAGERRVWEAEEMFELDVGSGGTVDLYLNGESLGTPGAGRRLVENVVINEGGIVPR